MDGGGKLAPPNLELEQAPTVLNDLLKSLNPIGRKEYSYLWAPTVHPCPNSSEMREML